MVDVDERDTFTFSWPGDSTGVSADTLSPEEPGDSTVYVSEICKIE